MSYIDDKNTSILVLAYPQLKDADQEYITNIRKKYDSLFYGMVDPHFTIVFPTTGISLNDFKNEVHQKITIFKSFKFSIRCAVMNNDSLSDYYHVFLSPDEGNSNIVKMHDHLYSGLLRKTQLLEIDFCSHISVGSSKEIHICKKIVDEINEETIEINGTIDSLSIITYGNRKVNVIEKIKLQ